MADSFTRGLNHGVGGVDGIFHIHKFLSLAEVQVGFNNSMYMIFIFFPTLVIYSTLLSTLGFLS
jgi:hypothetical protein